MPDPSSDTVFEPLANIVKRQLTKEMIIALIKNPPEECTEEFPCANCLVMNAIFKP